MKVVLLGFFASLLKAHAFQAVPTSVPRAISSVRPLQMSSAPESTEEARIRIQYCTGCRWMLKSFWMAQELLTTFEKDLDSVTIVPSSDNKGIYTVHLNGDDLLWDRKERHGFPSPKELKQIIRDKIQPDKFLGHSDTEERQKEEVEILPKAESEVSVLDDDELFLSLDPSEAPQPAIEIYYCTGCRWLLRAAYFGQEILTTFSDEIKSVTIAPSRKSGQFSIVLNGEVLFDRKTEGRFPEVKEIKQMIRDVIAPEKFLGHSDVAEVEQLIHDKISEEENDKDELGDDEAAEQRKFFGVL